VDDYVIDEAQVAEDLYQFLQLFFAQNPSYNFKFFVFGESYAGHYIPAVGARIVAGNNNLKKGDVKINLMGVAIGNGWVDPTIQYGYYADYLYQANLLDAVSKAAYDDTAYPACEALIEVNWFAALEECSLAMEAVLADAEAQNGRTINVYDVTQRCNVEPLCYDFSLATTFMTSPVVMKALGANPKVQWVDCNMEVHTGLLGDWIGNYAIDVPAILGAKIPVLVYSGTNDWICNYLGGEAWVSQMSWPGTSGYNAAAWGNWTGPNNSQAGRSKTFSGLTFLEVFNAGHMVPMNQPQNALQMVKLFLAGQPFSSQ
jgi:carboxypeptidase C (cathepsin A)